MQWNAVENKEEQKYHFKGRISSLQVDEEDNMHVLTLQGEYKIYNIRTKAKVGELPDYQRS
jgi:hypothetical protein